MSIGIIGYGVVGKAIDSTLSSKYTIVRYDKFFPHDPFDNLIDCDFLFITVPTPFDCKKNRVDDSAIKESLERLDERQYEGLVIIKSTIPPGFTDSYSKIYKLNIVFNPEFLRESTTPNEDFKNQEIVVIGTESNDLFISVKKMYESVLNPDIRYVHTSVKEAEMIKLAQNTILASRVALANVVYDACEHNGIDYKLVREIAFDSFNIIGPSMCLVPGPDGNRGFGGKCLPKDVMAFSTITTSKLIDEIISYNNNLRNDLDQVYNYDI